jgi:hypothetical protein
MASLSGTQIKNTYTGLLKTSANDAITTSLKRITDGQGANSALQLSSSQVKVDSLLIENVSETNTLTRFLTWDNTAKTVGFYNFSNSDPAVSVAESGTTATVTTGTNANNTFTLSEGTGIDLSVTGTTITITNNATVGATVTLNASDNKYSVTDTSGATKSLKLLGSGGTTVSSVATADSGNTLTATISSLERNVTKKEYVTLTGDTQLTASQSGKTLVIFTAMNAGDGLVLPEWEAGLFFDVIFRTAGGAWSLETYSETDGICGQLTIHSGSVQNGSSVSNALIKVGSQFALNHARSTLTCFQPVSSASGRPNKINFANSYDINADEQLVGGIHGSKFTILATTDNNWFIYGDVHSTNAFNTDVAGDQDDANGTTENYHPLEVFTNWTSGNSDFVR